MLKLKNNAAFTLIELLVVVIIVAVLAAVGVPLLSANIRRSRASEADAGLGTIRTAVRAYIAENGNATGATLANIGLTSNDFGGRWFDFPAFALNVSSGTNYCITADGGSSGAPRRDQVNGTNRLSHSMNQDGQIMDYATGAPSSTCAGGTVLN
jgi:prepilin-type N-terminal cleavage/methylation domain-containing protein